MRLVSALAAALIALTVFPAALSRTTYGSGSADSVMIAPWCSQFNAPGNDNDNLNEEYVCLQNLAAVPAAMTGWHVTDEYGYLYTFGEFSLPSGAHVRLRSGAGVDTATDVYWGQSVGVWNNGGDTVYLYDHEWALVHAHTYGSATPAPSLTPTSTGIPTPTPTASPTRSPTRSLPLWAAYLPIAAKPALAPTPTPTATPTPICQQYIANGSFENGSESWTLDSARGVTGQYDWPHGEAGVLLSTEDEVFPQGASHVTQGWWDDDVLFTLASDSKEITLSLWHRLLGDWEFDRGGDCDVLYVSVSGPNKQYYDYALATCSLSYGHRQAEPFEKEWTYVEWDVSDLRGREVSVLRLSFQNDRENLTTLLIDNVALWACR